MKQRLESILAAMDDIEYFLEQKEGKIVASLEDRILKPAIRMKIMTIAEQFNRLKDENEFELLSHFEKGDLRGLNAVRNFIAHDYDSVDDEILEIVLRVHFPKLKTKVSDLLT